MRHKIGLVLGAAALVAASAQAETEGSNFYAGAMFETFSVDSNNDVGSNDDINAAGITGIVGLSLSDYFAVEGQASFSPEGEEIGSSDAPLSIGLNSSFGIFAKASYPPKGAFSFYGRAGYLTADFDIRDVDFGNGEERTESQSDSGFAFGGGFELNFGAESKNTIRFGYTRADLDALPIDSFSVGYLRKF